MNILYKLYKKIGGTNQIVLNNTKKDTMGNPSTTLSFGIKKVEVNVLFSEDLQEDEIQISENLITELSIPIPGKFQVNFRSNEMIIGPYIGIIAYLEEKDLLLRLRDLNSYVKYYHEIGGVITAFSLDQIEPKQDYINSGYIYFPLQKKWVKTEKIPFPASLFNKCKVIQNEQWDYLSSLYGNKMFNYPTFDKWQMYQWLSEDSYLNSKLPPTKICQTPKDLLKFIKTVKEAYLKPIGGTFAKGIIKLSYFKEGIAIRFEKRRNTVDRFIDDKSTLSNYFEGPLNQDSYLIQEAIPLLSINEQIIDFRYIFIKNQRSQWENGGLFARYGKEDSIVSNLTRGGIGKDGKEALLEFFPEKQVVSILETMNAISVKAAHILENKLDQCGNLGFDFGVDPNGNVWIIEINNEDPDHRIATVCKRIDRLYYARLQNMLYAKRLAGFD